MCLFKAPKPPPLPEPKPADELFEESIRASRASQLSAREATRLTAPLGLPQGAVPQPATKILLGG